MKKDIRDIYRQQRLHLKSVRRKNKFQKLNTVHQKIKDNAVQNDLKLLGMLKDTAFQQFSHFITPGVNDETIVFPKNFCFCSNYSECLKVIKNFTGSMYDFVGSVITLDFSGCEKADTAALFVLQIIRLELLEKLRRLEDKLEYITVIPTIDVTPPKSKDVLRLMLISGYPISKSDLINSKDDSTLNPIHLLGYFKGSSTQKHYLENKKSVYTASVVAYLNECLSEHGYMFTEIEVNSIDGIISEILSNAEDHSGTKDWFITANFSKEISNSGSEVVGEINLTIMNFGNSIYEAFKETKLQNLSMYTSVDTYAKTILNNNKSCQFTEEQLYTLATMQEQVSRLKFERESRGTGTMKFINSFLELGDYEDVKKGFVPNLSIFSGNVQLTCDNTYKPFLKDEVYCLSLNSEKDLSKEPSKTHLKLLPEKFPGTLLSVKIYLNKDHLDKKYGGSHEREN